MSMSEALEIERQTVEEVGICIDPQHGVYFTYGVSGDMIAVLRRGGKKSGVTVRRRCAQLKEQGELDD